MKKVYVLGISCLLTAQLFAGGFQVALQGQKQIGMGHIGAPMLFGASSIYFNPGALPMLDNKFSASGGVSFVASNVVFQNTEFNYNAETNNPVGTPLEVYANYIVKEKLSLGIGVYTPFGSTVSWEDDWEGRNLIRPIKLRAIFVQPTIGYKILDNLGIGVGLVYVNGDVGIKRALPLPVGNSEESVELESKANGLGANIGIHFSPIEKLNIGLSFKTKINIEAKGGDAKFIDVPSSLAENFPASNKFDTELPLPGSINVGASYDVNDKLTLATELNFVQWSAYDSLNFDFKTNTAGLPDSRNPRHYENTMTFRLGANYKINEQFEGRAGFYYDPSPVPSNYFSPETPNMNNLGYTVGASYAPIENLSINLSFLYIQGLKRTAEYAPANFGGEYKTNAMVPGIGLSYQF